jgi:hypothetical protein
MAMPSIGEVSGLKDKLTWLKGNAQSGGSYVLEIDTDEECEPRLSSLFSCAEFPKFSYKGKSNITITLKGIGRNRTIYLYLNQNSMVDSGVTLILDDNITLQKKYSKDPYQTTLSDNFLVNVFSGGTLVMNEGSAIIGAANNYNGTDIRAFVSARVDVYSRINSAGVKVYDGGTFIMNGGTISGNASHPQGGCIGRCDYAGAGVHIGNNGTFIMKGGTISGNTMYLAAIGTDTISKTEYKVKVWYIPPTPNNINTISSRSAGVYVSGGKENLPIGSFTKKLVPSGTFIKTGGTITGYSSDQKNGNVVRGIDGEVINGFGHAVFFDSLTTITISEEIKKTKAIDTTIGPEITINFKNGVFSEGRNEEVKPQEAIAEPEEAQPQEGE